MRPPTSHPPIPPKKSCHDHLKLRMTRDQLKIKMREYDDVLFQSAITPVSGFCRLATNKGRQSYLFRAPSATVGQSQSSSLSPSTPMEPVSYTHLTLPTKLSV